MKNVDKMCGSGGTPDFFVIADLNACGDNMRIGIRPLYAGKIQGNHFAVDFGFRVRYQGTHKIDPDKLKALLNNGKTGETTNVKAYADYGSYMLYNPVGAPIDAKAHKLLAGAKQALIKRIGHIYDHAKTSGATMRFTREEVINFFVEKACAEASQIKMDFGEFDSPDVPEDQPFVAAFKNKQAGNLPKPDPTKVSKAPDPKAVQEEPDKYAKKELTEDDLAGLSFDQLMGAISKKAHGDQSGEEKDQE